MNEKNEKTTKNRKKGTKVIKVRGKREKRIRAVIGIISAVLVLSVLLYIVPSVMSRKRNIEARNQSGITDLDLQDKAEEKDENFLFSVEDGELRSIESLSGYELLITSNSFVTFKPSGKIISSTRIGYSNPVVRKGSDRYLVFERSTGKYAIMNKKGIVHNFKLDNSIINADIAENGYYAILTRETLTTSYLTVYNKKNEIEFRWKCTDGYLMNVALSRNGKNIAVSMLSVEDGEEVSSVLYFTVKSGDIEKKLDYKGSTVYGLKFLKGLEIGIVTDKAYMIADPMKESTEIYSFDYDTVKGFCFDENMNAVILKSNFGSMDNSNIIIIDKDCKNIFSVTSEEEIISFEASSQLVYSMSDGLVSIYNTGTQEKVQELETLNGAKDLCICSGNVLCISENGVYKYKR